MMTAQLYIVLSYFQLISMFAVANPVDSKGTFWHISDAHWDPQVDLKRSCVIAVKDIPSWGSHFCDSPLRLVKFVFSEMKRLVPDPDFILWTGDSALHYWNGTEGTEEEIVHIVTYLSEALASEFPTTPVVTSLGNHDFVPDNQLPASMNEIYTNISNVWSRLGWFTNEVGEQGSFQKYGYYSVRLPSGMSVMAMNTNFYYQSNKVYNSQSGDPGQQFEHLESLLKSARLNSSKVLITAHVPYGVGAQGDYVHMYESFNKRFISLIQEYHDVIAGSFFGHEHSDNFKLMFDSDGGIVSVGYLAPSITPWTYIIPGSVNSPYHNPAVNLFEYDRNTVVIQDKLQYHFDLLSANQGGDVKMKKLYRFTETYGVTDCSPESMLQAADRIRSGVKFQEYLRGYYCKREIDDVTCDEKCRAGMSCAIYEVSQHGAKECVKKIETTCGAATSASAVRLHTVAGAMLVFSELYCL